MHGLYCRYAYRSSRTRGAATGRGTGSITLAMSLPMTYDRAMSNTQAPYDIQVNAWPSESDARIAMLAAETRYDYEVAAIAALHYADYVGVRSPDGAIALTQRAHVYATLFSARIMASHSQWVSSAM